MKFVFQYVFAFGWLIFHTLVHDVVSDFNFDVSIN